MHTDPRKKTLCKHLSTVQIYLMRQARVTVISGVQKFTLFEFLKYPVGYNAANRNVSTEL